MKTKWLLGSVLALSFAIPASGQVSFGVTIGAPPPPLRYEVPPPMPAPGYVWVDGYWVPRVGAGCGGTVSGVGLRTQARTGLILTMTTTPMDGMSMMAIGLTRTTTITTGSTIATTKKLASTIAGPATRRASFFLRKKCYWFGRPLALLIFADVEMASGRIAEGKFGRIAWSFFPDQPPANNIPGGITSLRRSPG
jgi:hypothetical protein